MNAYHLIFTHKRGETGVVVTAKTPHGESYGVAHGQSVSEALRKLREMAIESMASMAMDGDAPLVILGHGEPDHEEAVFSSKELFPIVLRYLRVHQGITQSEMAACLSVTQPTYNGYERYDANPTLETINRLEQALGCPILPLIDGSQQVA